MSGDNIEAVEEACGEESGAGLEIIVCVVFIISVVVVTGCTVGEGDATSLDFCVVTKLSPPRPGMAHASPLHVPSSSGPS